MKAELSANFLLNCIPNIKRKVAMLHTPIAGGAQYPKPLHKSKGILICLCRGNSTADINRLMQTHMEENRELDWAAILATYLPRDQSRCVPFMKVPLQT